METTINTKNLCRGSEVKDPTWLKAHAQMHVHWCKQKAIKNKNTNVLNNIIWEQDHGNADTNLFDCLWKKKKYEALSMSLRGTTYLNYDIK